ncbi:GT2 family glycosyltransferase [Sphingomonas sp. BK036]|uniref:glycosyltransferase family 2 protein n=1 Tax=Sphingomonas sp. BK036 TaxID=2512122 RepID=UPI0010E2520F|nr:glycosyltransferase family 2 protein [Sphingomonas sp. BK036]RZT52942.1 GT2 family glycosyltransferase [Sphingomonas sp. BK036]
MTQAIDVSLLVCTRNRASSLASTLESVERAAAYADHLAVEIVLVDNGSIDDTPRRLAQWQAMQPFSVHLVHEPHPGLARARNTGLARCTGRIVAMTDDDCVLHENYFSALCDAFERVSRPAIIGGRILLGNPADLPVTIKLEDHPMVAPSQGFPGGFVMGANLAFTADVRRLTGCFDERFGAGAPFIAAEDTDFLFRAAGLGVAVLYDPRMVVDHHHGRRDVDDETRLLAGYSFGDGALYAKYLFSDRRALRAIVDDILAVRFDLTRPVTTHAGIRRFYWFRLRHKSRGFTYFWWIAIRSKLRRIMSWGA